MHSEAMAARKNLSYDEYQNFCRLVHWYSEKGYRLEEAEDKAYNLIAADLA